MELEGEDVKVLCGHGLIVPRENAHLDIRTFSVVEARKRRRRWITHTAESNDLTKDEWSLLGKRSQRQDLVTPTVGKATSGVARSYATAIDFAAWYHQFGLDPCDRMWYFTAEGKDWELTTIPTGSSFAPALAQIFSVALCGWVKHHFPLISSDTYIDNVRLLADDPGYLQDALVCLYKICARLSVIINEPMETALDIIRARKYEFLGVVYDHSAKEVKLGDHICDRIAMASTIPRDKLQILDVLAWYGRLSYASMVHRISRAQFYHATKYLRRRVGRDLEAPAHLWTSAWRDMVRWGQIILEMGWGR